MSMSMRTAVALSLLRCRSLELEREVLVLLMAKRTASSLLEELELGSMEGMPALLRFGIIRIVPVVIPLPELYR
jgi:hypothetical protein